MLPKKHSRTVIETWWECHNPAHCHTTEDIARRCIARKESARSGKQNTRVPNVWTDEKRLALLRRYRSGRETLKAIGSSYGVGGARIRTLIEEAKRIEARHKASLYEARKPALFERLFAGQLMRLAESIAGS
jgi:hypothetical protein